MPTLRGMLHAAENAEEQSRKQTKSLIYDLLLASTQDRKQTILALLGNVRLEAGFLWSDLG